MESYVRLSLLCGSFESVELLLLHPQKKCPCPQRPANTASAFGDACKNIKLPPVPFPETALDKGDAIKAHPCPPTRYHLMG